MSEDKTYIEKRKIELENDFAILKDRTFNKILQLIREWQQDAGIIQQKFNELNKKDDKPKK